MEYGVSRNKPAPPGMLLEFIRSCNFGTKGEIKEIPHYIAVHLLEKGIAVASPSSQFSASKSPAAFDRALYNAQSFVLVSMKNGCGLQADYEILQKMLTAAGKTVHVVMAHGHEAVTFRHTDVVVFLEIMDYRWLPYAKEAWLIPNSEWWREEWNQFMPAVSRVLCKTKDCYALWSTRALGRCVYLGFESNDYYSPAVSRKREFLHVSGGSINKGTQAVIAAWASLKLPYPLTILGTNFNVPKALLTSTSHMKWIARTASIRQIMNEFQFHILPSRYEGWGHALHEALGVGAVLITTDAPPMNEATGIPKELLVKVASIDHRRVPSSMQGGLSMTNMYNVTPEDVAEKVKQAWAMTAEQVSTASKAAREGFLLDREAFRTKFSEVITPPHDIVLVTTFYRAEYLWNCLQALADADGGKDKEVWIIQDHHNNEGQRSGEQAENAAVVQHFKDKFATLRFVDQKATAYIGNSHSCLESYKAAFHAGARLIYLVEDDIIVARDFFRWHEAAQASGDYLCTVGRLQASRPDLQQSDDPNAVVESRSDYTSWGACWKRSSLMLLLPHCCPEYYADMNGYIRRAFPQDPFNGIFTEQDGLIRRVLVQSGKSTASPSLKRAFHIGITGYHRNKGHRFTGTLGERVQQLADALKQGSLPSLRRDFVDLNDIDIPQTNPDFTNLTVTQRLV